jgi:hypothetical protein
MDNLALPNTACGDVTIEYLGHEVVRGSTAWSGWLPRAGGESRRFDEAFRK